ncbi:hypothetical protein ACPWSH_26635, partial [Pandoraea pneumonica]|uniref:hypothetical protein n=1 Tax=Pandoraea pneumonica TaxID=2508299 RepID=UPI003CFA0C5F
MLPHRRDEAIFQSEMAWIVMQTKSPSNLATRGAITCQTSTKQEVLMTDHPRPACGTFKPF